MEVTIGLDSYLTAERFFWFNETKPVVEGIEVQSVKAKAAYWRKANQIHAWFVDNVQGGEDECRPHYVSRDQLRELRDLCQQALDTEKPLLEPRSGFFFGSTEIDEWYWEDLKNTVEMIDKALADFPEDKWNFEYRSSW